MKRRAILSTLAAGASLAATPINSPITFDRAMTIAMREIERRGLAETHRLTALHGAPDARTEGAAFAVSVSPRPGASASHGRTASGKLKLLIEHDGRVLVRPWKQGGNASIRARV